jgi:hypothetical protein
MDIRYCPVDSLPPHSGPVGFSPGRRRGMASYAGRISLERSVSASSNAKKRLLYQAL